MCRIIVAAMVLWQFFISEALADVVIIVRREAEAPGNYVRVWDIARVEGPKDQVSEVARTVLGPTPPRGEVREITRWDIESRLFEMGVEAKVSFSGNDMVRVFGSGARLRHSQPEALELSALNAFFESPNDASLSGFAKTPDASAAKTSPAGTKPPALGNPPLEATPYEIRERLNQEISQYLAGQYTRPDVEIGVKLLTISEPIPSSARDIRVEEATEGRVPGKATLRLSVREASDSQPRLVMASADTEVFALAPVVVKPFYKGEVIRAKDVRVERVKMESGRNYLPPNPRAADGRELRRNLAAGEPLLASDAVLGEAVKRGDYVQNIVRNNGWEVRSAGKALGGGMVGDVITVEDIGNKTKYQARITGRGIVSVLAKPMTPEPTKQKGEALMY